MGGVKLLKASAGSGKTYQLAYEYVRNVIIDPSQYRHILAVTFTNKATEEMKHRIIDEISALACGKKSGYLTQLQEDTGFDTEAIQKRAAQARTKILHDYSHFAILTIDKFFQRIIRSFIKELGIELNFNLELQTDTLLSSAADLLIDEISVDEALRKWILEFVEEKIEENKKWDIKTELTRLGTELFKENYKRSESEMASKEKLGNIVAKTTSHALAIRTQMQNEANKALIIIEQAGLCIGDFANGWNGFANYFTKIASGEIVPYGKRVSDALASEEKWYAKNAARKEDILKIIPQLYPILKSLCETYDKNIKFLNSAALLRENYRNFALLTDLARKIEELCAAENIMPISETNHILHRLIADNDTPFIFEKVGNHYTHFMIDEFQDTSAMQWENFIPLLENAVAQSDENPVLLVGDVKQSIYRWRGGDWRILADQIHRQFRELIPINLTVNYRSRENIVTFNNNLIAACTETDNAQLNAELETAYEKGYIRSACKTELTDMLRNAYANQAQQTVPDQKGGYVNLTLYTRDEATGELLPPVIARIEQLQQRGYAPGDIAILVRYNADGAKIANMILDYKSLHPDSPYGFDVVTQEALTIGSSPTIGFVIACLKIASSPNDTINRAIYNQWCGAPFDQELSQDEVDFFRQIRLLSPSEAFETLLNRFRLGDKSSNIAYLQAFHEQILTFCNSTVADIPLFVKWWEENGAKQSIQVPAGKSSITIISIHKAKGLQYKAVIIPYCNWSLIPNNRTILWAENSQANPEFPTKIPIAYKEKMRESYYAEDFYNELVLSHVDNINTFYVATTRAMEELHLMIPDNSRKTGDRISTLINECLQISDDQWKIGQVGGRLHQEKGLTIMEFGEPILASTKRLDSEEVLYLPYPSYDTTDRLALKLQQQRYTENNDRPYDISPRDFGILMHQVFESAGTTADIEQAILDLEQNGHISPEETLQLHETVRKAFQNPLVQSWFDGTWEHIRNESGIILPQSSDTRRPDRVMLKGDRAVVVDYKFVLNRPASHRRQIREYMDLLKQMGYKNIEGYLWYVSLDDIEPVSLPSDQQGVL